MSHELLPVRSQSENWDEAAFSQFYRETFARYVARCVRMGVRAQDAPGIVQEVMLEIYRRGPKEIESPQAYANVTVPRRAAGFLKLSSWSSRDNASLARLGQLLTAGLPRGVLTIEEKDLVLEALDQLTSPQQRAVFALVYDDYKCVEIAKILEMRADTVRSHLRNARAVLRPWWWNRRIQGKRPWWNGRIQGKEVDPHGAR
jgi:RNA polymerase sigma factor (sigma-70 family)